MSRPDLDARVTLEAAISPSEDPAKVSRALLNVVGGGSAEVLSGSTSARLATSDFKILTHVRDQLRDRHIRAAARRQMLLNAQGNSTSLMLNRQAAVVGVIALCGSAEESPLGPIHMTIESETLEAVIDWLSAYSG
jgi:hypothetical protein